MNSKRFLLGLVSSLLFAVGLVRAATTLDPLSREASQMQTSLSSAPDCWDGGNPPQRR